MSLTGRLSPESQFAALTRCFRCSRLILMSLRERMPRIVGTRPTAVNGLIICLPQKVSLKKSAAAKAGVDGLAPRISACQKLDCLDWRCRLQRRGVEDRVKPE